MICLSFDTDHMSEARMVEFFSTIRFPGRGTFFCTQRYDVLADMEHEVAPHPYLGPEADWDRELAAKRAEFPDAIGWRAHSCVFSHILAEWLGKNGYRYISTHDQFGETGIRPVCHPWGIWHLPIYYMDNMDFSRRRFWGEKAAAPFAPELIERAVTEPDLHVFDFHPIHLMLNTPDADYYLAIRDRFRQGEAIEHLRFDGYGTANFFADLCTAMSRTGMASCTMQDALDQVAS